MSGKRKDKNGRVLKDGESQRPNHSYMYRYVDINKKRQYVYAKSLDALRKKVAAIQKDLADGIDYNAGEITVAELVDRYIALKGSLKQNSLRAYGSAINRLKKDPFGHRLIRDIKLSDAKGWFVELHDQGLKQNTIGVVQSVVRPAFEMAVDDDMIRKNPFKFKLADVVAKDAYVRDALSKEEQELYLQFAKAQRNTNYYEDIVILLGTGFRIGELYGLTKDDVDMENCCLHIRRQLGRTAKKSYFTSTTKTASGVRTVPMSDAVVKAVEQVLLKRGSPKEEFVVDGVSGFLFLDKNGKPKTPLHLGNHMRTIHRRMEKENVQITIKVTPHILRHTFCTNLQQAGIDVKSLQYLMGHSNVSVTLDVYAHTNFNRAQDAFRLAVGGM